VFHCSRTAGFPADTGILSEWLLYSVFCCILVVVVVLVLVLVLVLVVVLVLVDTFYPLHTAVLEVVVDSVDNPSVEDNHVVTRSQVSLSASDSCLAWTLSTQASCQFQYQSV